MLPILALGRRFGNRSQFIYSAQPFNSSQFVLMVCFIGMLVPLMLEFEWRQSNARISLCFSERRLTHDR
jgi:formate-dependent nitrite reductase membrane component NrfD